MIARKSTNGLDRFLMMHKNEIGDGEAVLVDVAPTLHTVAKDRIVHGVITTEVIDLDDELILLNGLDLSLFPKQYRAVYLDHQYTRESGVAAVGVCRTFVVKGSTIVTDTYIAKTELGNEVLQAVIDGVLRHFSIGFRVIETRAPTPEEIAKYGARLRRVISKALLLEYSFTSMPANPYAEIDSGEEPGVVLPSSAPQLKGRKLVLGEGLAFVAPGI